MAALAHLARLHSPDEPRCDGGADPGSHHSFGDPAGYPQGRGVLQGRAAGDGNQRSVGRKEAVERRPRDDLDESPDGEVDHRLRRARAGAVVLDDPDDLPRANGLLRSSPWRIDEERAESELRKQDAREGARLPAGAGRTARPPIPRRVLAHRSAASPGANWFVRRRRRSA